MLKFLLKPKGKRREYRGRFRVGDNPKIHEVALYTTVKEVAEKRLNEAYEDAQKEDAGLIPGKVTRSAMKRPLLELFEEFMKEKRKSEVSVDYLNNLRLRFPQIVKYCRWKTLSDITPKSLLDWRNSNHGFSVRYQNHFLDAMRVFLNWAERTYQTPNPLKHLQKLRVPQPSSDGPRAFTEDELSRLYAAAPRRRFFYRLLALTGLRHKEASRLIWADVRLDGDNPGLFLRPEATKSRRADWLPILKDLVPEFRAARPVFAKPETRVFWKGAPNMETLHRDFAKAGIQHQDDLGRAAGFHTFRRTFISHLQKRGVHSRVIMQLARHKSLRMTDVTYTDATQLPLREGIETLANLVKAGTPNLAPVSLPEPLKSGQKGVLKEIDVHPKKSQNLTSGSQPVESEAVYPLPSLVVQDCPILKVVGEQGLELNFPREAKSFNNADLVDC